MASRFDLFEHLPRLAGIFTGGDMAGRRDAVEQMMRRPGAFSGVGLAVPMSNSRYMATESQFTISPWKCSASARESAVFPLAVGPRTTTSSGSSCTEAHRQRKLQ